MTSSKPSFGTFHRDPESREVYQDWCLENNQKYIRRKVRPARYDIYHRSRSGSERKSMSMSCYYISSQFREIYEYFYFRRTVVMGAGGMVHPRSYISMVRCLVSL